MMDHRDPATIQHLISVDPGTKLSAWALWRHELDDLMIAAGVWTLERFNLLKRPTPPRLRAVLDRVLGLPGVDRELLHLVVELQWLGPQRATTKHRGAPHQAVLQLACQRAHWEAVAELAGVTHEGQDPRWVATATRGAPMVDDIRGRDSERRLAWVGRRRWPTLEQGERAPTKDEWAAIMLGTHWLQQNGQQLARPRPSDRSRGLERKEGEVQIGDSSENGEGCSRRGDHPRDREERRAAASRRLRHIVARGQERNVETINR